MVTVASIYLRFYIKFGIGVSTFLWTLTPPKIPSNSTKIPSDSFSTALVPTELLPKIKICDAVECKQELQLPPFWRSLLPPSSG
jgi:hypothetical protein